jgi:hypothetical protein
VPRLPRVVGPIRTLFTREGIEIALISVELWPSRLVVRLAALPNEISDERRREHEVEFERWGKIRVERGKAAAGDPPEGPGTTLLRPLEIEVEDDAGTIYMPRSGNTGGSGSEWHGDWFFTADMPRSVGRLTVRVTTPEGETATVPLDLDDSSSSGRARS